MSEQAVVALAGKARQGWTGRWRFGLVALAGLVAITTVSGGWALAKREVEVPFVSTGSQGWEIPSVDAPTSGYWLVVDSYGNRLEVHRGTTLVRQVVVSTGSGTALRDPRTGKMWVFRTPVGERSIQRKARDPVWTKPDWAFVEEGVAPPPIGSPDRIDRISLGDYALYLGDGYILHGTLFQTLLGRRITHGCVRIGDDDLRWLYENIPVGTRVYIY